MWHGPTDARPTTGILALFQRCRALVLSIRASVAHRRGRHQERWEGRKIEAQIEEDSKHKTNRNTNHCGFKANRVQIDADCRSYQEQRRREGKKEEGTSSANRRPSEQGRSAAAVRSVLRTGAPSDATRPAPERATTSTPASRVPQFCATLAPLPASTGLPDWLEGAARRGGRRRRGWRRRGRGGGLGEKEM
nr:unnamed protein product [Digitaria exilis]